MSTCIKVVLSASICPCAAQPESDLNVRLSVACPTNSRPHFSLETWERFSATKRFDRHVGGKKCGNTFCLHEPRMEAEGRAVRLAKHLFAPLYRARAAFGSGFHAS